MHEQSNSSVIEKAILKPNNEIGVPVKLDKVHCSRT